MDKRIRQTGKAMENARTDDPVDPKGGNASQRSRLHAATAIQSSVTPDDYPEADRAEQVAGATDGRPARKKR